MRRIKRKGGKLTKAELEQRRIASRTGVLKRIARKPYGKQDRPDLTEAQLLAERVKQAARNVDEARLILRESAAHAARTVAMGSAGVLAGADANAALRAADSLLKKVGLGDTLKVEGGPPVIVHLGGMDEYPPADAEADGFPPDKTS